MRLTDFSRLVRALRGLSVGDLLESYILPTVNLRDALAARVVAANNGDLTNQGAGTVVVTHTVDEDGLYRCHTTLVGRTAFAATVGFELLVLDDAVAPIAHWEGILGTATGGRMDWPIIEMWLRRNWSFRMTQVEATGAGETYRFAMVTERIFAD